MTKSSLPVGGYSVNPYVGCTCLLYTSLQEIQEKDEKLMCFQEQEERLQQLESELSELLQILPNTEELLILLEEKTDQIQKLTDENQQ